MCHQHPVLRTCALALPLLAAACAAPDEAALSAAAARDAILERHDRNGDGRVERAEYDRTDAGFEALDRDDDGVVSALDFAQPAVMPTAFAVPMLLVRWFGGQGTDRVTWDQVDAGFTRADADGDDRLARAEFEAFLTAAGAEPGADRFGTLCAGADRDQDGVLARAELLRDFLARDLDADGVLRRQERSLPGPEPRVGWFEPHERDAAPDFTLPSATGTGAVALAGLRGRPVALVFGSFS